MQELCFPLEFLTPALIGGADPIHVVGAQDPAPKVSAELRPHSIRCQWRFWFRLLGGFVFLPDSWDLRQQEAYVFGAADGRKDSWASKWIVRVQGPDQGRFQGEPSGWPLSYPSEESTYKELAGEDKEYPYGLFQLRADNNREERPREFFQPATAWWLRVLVFEDGQNPELYEGMRALGALWIHFGGLELRSHRGFGAISRKGEQSLPSLSEALSYFRRGEEFRSWVRILHGVFSDPQSAHRNLIRWLRDWREHGRSYRKWDKKKHNWVLIEGWQPDKPKILYARRDHDEGLRVLKKHLPCKERYRHLESQLPGKEGTTFRPALGLPILQYFSSLGKSDKPDKDTPCASSEATAKWLPTPLIPKAWGALPLRCSSAPTGPVQVATTPLSFSWNQTGDPRAGRFTLTASLARFFRTLRSDEKGQSPTLLSLG